MALTGFNCRTTCKLTVLVVVQVVMVEMMVMFSGVVEFWGRGAGRWEKTDVVAEVTHFMVGFCSEGVVCCVTRGQRKE